MDEIKTKFILNIEIRDIDIIAKLETLSCELSISTEQFMLKAINKLLIDIEFTRSLRNYNKSNIKN